MKDWLTRDTSVLSLNHFRIQLQGKNSGTKPVSTAQKKLNGIFFIIIKILRAISSTTVIVLLLWLMYTHTHTLTRMDITNFSPHYV